MCIIHIYSMNEISKKRKIEQTLATCKVIFSQYYFCHFNFAWDFKDVSRVSVFISRLVDGAIFVKLIIKKSGYTIVYLCIKW